MTGRVFIDTNIFVYAVDKDEPQKKAIARSLISDLSNKNQVMISLQVLSEFYWVTTRKLKSPLSLIEAEHATISLANLPIVNTNSNTVIDAITLSREKPLSYWDSLIIQSAILGGCTTIITEDLQHDHSIANISILNPF
ncbi:MAG: PIN domain-containing protein [Deltaproteobacteria bacterium]|nr:PIN domain-containing protein [Deltaproteobacteria bacterium]